MGEEKTILGVFFSAEETGSLVKVNQTTTTTTTTIIIIIIEIKRDHLIHARRPDLVVLNNKKREPAEL